MRPTINNFAAAHAIINLGFGVIKRNASNLKIPNLALQKRDSLAKVKVPQPLHNMIFDFIKANKNFTLPLQTQIIEELSLNFIKKLELLSELGAPDANLLLKTFAQFKEREINYIHLQNLIGETDLQKYDFSLQIEPSIRAYKNNALKMMNKNFCDILMMQTFLSLLDLEIFIHPLVSPIEFNVGDDTQSLHVDDMPVDGYKTKKRAEAIAIFRIDKAKIDENEVKTIRLNGEILQTILPQLLSQKSYKKLQEPIFCFYPFKLKSQIKGDNLFPIIYFDEQDEMNFYFDERLFENGQLFAINKDGVSALKEFSQAIRAFVFKDDNNPFCKKIAKLLTELKLEEDAVSSVVLKEGEGMILQHSRGFHARQNSADTQTISAPKKLDRQIIIIAAQQKREMPLQFSQPLPIIKPVESSRIGNFINYFFGK